MSGIESDDALDLMWVNWCELCESAHEPCEPYVPDYDEVFGDEDKEILDDRYH